jgi:hypothetical protein
MRYLRGLNVDSLKYILGLRWVSSPIAREYKNIPMTDASAKRTKGTRINMEIYDQLDCNNVLYIRLL